MPRKPRVEYEGAAYHVMSRGNRGGDISTDDRDRTLFLDTLDEATVRTAWEIHAFVLMRNHYHFLLVTPHANLVEGMKWCLVLGEIVSGMSYSTGSRDWLRK